MDTKRVLAFLDLLVKETEGRNGELADLYKRTLDEEDCVIRINRLITEYTPFGEIGKGFLRNADERKKELYADPARALELLPQLRQAYRTIENEAVDCARLMVSPLPFTQSVTVLKNKDITDYMEALRTIAGVCVYLILLYDGPKGIKDLTWNENVGISEMIYAVNTRFLPTLMKLYVPGEYWLIRKRRLGGSTLFGGDGFFLSYESASNIETMCDALNKEPMGTHSFLNIDAYETEANDVPFCWGRGNIVTVSPENALQILQKGLATRLRAPDAGELQRKMPTPFGCVRLMADRIPSCVSPEALLRVMNQWQMGHEIEKRKAIQSCIFCGKRVESGRLVCRSHFSSQY